MKKILFLTLILSLTLISSYYAGEPIYAGNEIVVPNELHITNLVYTIIENTENITILPDVQIDSDNITITFPADMPPNNFKIVFLEETTNTVVQTITVGGGGGSSSTKYVKEYVEVPNYVTEYVNQTIEKEVPVETEVEVIKNKTPLWAYFILLFFVVSILYIIFKTKESSKEKTELKGGLEEYE